MICSSCQFNNPDGIDFCGKCGDQLKTVCSSCSFPNPAEFSFCGKCGVELSEPDASSDATTSSPSSPLNSALNSVGERRHLTVMFCDLVGSTALSAELEPEELRDVVMDYQKMCKKVITRFGGHIAQYLGDGILVYFGYPKATENDANSCVRAALGIVSDLKDLNNELQKSKGLEVALRIGIHSGPTVIGDIQDGTGQSQHLAHGKTLNLAARLEGLAGTNAIVISEDTYKLVHDHFIVVEKGKHELKGIKGAIPIYEVQNEKVGGLIRSRRDNVLEKTAPIIGRRTEIKIILDLWQRAQNGNSEFIMISGEAGMGKSVLVKEITEKVMEDPNVLVIPHLCSPYHRNTAYYAFTNSMRQLGLRITGTESDEELLSRLVDFLARSDSDMTEIVPLFAKILGISIKGSVYTPSTMSLAGQKNRIDQTLLKIMLNAAEKRPVVMVFEDLHYADSATLDVIGLFTRYAVTAPLMLLMSYRPEFIPTWKGQPNLSSIVLGTLKEQEIVHMIDRIAEGKELPTKVVEEIIKKTDGVPLFVEELSKTILSSGILSERDGKYEIVGQLASLSIPSTLQDSLIARLDKMSNSKRIAQIGATIGRQFDFDLIHAVTKMDQDELETSLLELVDAEILTQTGFIPNAEFMFRHALIKDAAYGSLLKSQQKTYHANIYAALTEKFDDLVEEHPELAAYHSENAEQYDKAEELWFMAGDKARGNLVGDESLAYLNRALAMNARQESSRELNERELKILCIKAPLCFWTKGYTSNEAYLASNRINEIASEHDDTQGGFMALKNMVLYEIFTGHCALALEHANEALRIAKRTKEVSHLIEAHRLIGHSSMFLGKLQKSLEGFNRAISEYELIEGSENDTIAAREIYLFSLAQRAAVLWKLGFIDQSIASVEASSSRQNESNSVHLRSLTSFLHAIIYSFTGNVEGVLLAVSEVESLSDKHATEWFKKDIKTFAGAARINIGEVELGKQLLIEGWQGRKEMNFASGNIFHLTIGYSALKELNDNSIVKDYFNSLTENHERIDDRYALSEVHRIRAEILIKMNVKANDELIQKELDLADEIASEQHALSFELRNAMSRYVWKNTPDNLQKLRSTYGRFTEGFDTKDLKEAKELMEEKASVHL